MTFREQLNAPGEIPLLLQGAVGQLEGILMIPETLNSDEYIAFLGHPHSLQGGTMNNKVVTTMARAFKELGIPSLRFNFRGVGQSAGHYDDGIGESEDMIAQVRAWQKEFPNSKLIFAGFSFGSYVSYRAATLFKGSALITIAPSVKNYNYAEFNPVPSPWVIFQGTADEVVPFQLVMNFAQSFDLLLIEFLHTSHFFHGKLLELKAQLINYVQSQVL